MTIQECIDKWKREHECLDYGPIDQFIKDLEEIRDRPGPKFTLPPPAESKGIIRDITHVSKKFENWGNHPPPTEK